MNLLQLLHILQYAIVHTGVFLQLVKSELYDKYKNFDINKNGEFVQINYQYIYYTTVGGIIGIVIFCLIVFILKIINDQCSSQDNDVVLDYIISRQNDENLDVFDDV